MKVITNNHYRPLLSFWELSPREKKEMTDILEEKAEEDTFFRYKGTVYPLSDFMRTFSTPNWDGILSTTAFTAIVVKLSPDGEAVKVGLVLG